jgi:hypothetical protein
MPEKTTEGAANLVGDDEKNTPSAKWDPVSRSIDAGIEIVGGFAGAVGTGLKVFGDEISKEKGASSRKFSKGLVRGVFEGLARAMQEASGATRKAGDALLSQEKNSEK